MSVLALLSACAPGPGGEGGGDDAPNPSVDGGACNSNEAACSTGCANLASDLDNCGACGNECPRPAGSTARAACVRGTCTLTCDQGTLCDGECVDTMTDDDNCGECGNSCPSGIETTGVCRNGGCDYACETPGETLCSSGCVDTTSDQANCGACGKHCWATAPSSVHPSGCEASMCHGEKEEVVVRACPNGDCPSTTCDAICAQLGATCTDASVLFANNSTSCTMWTLCGTSLATVPRCHNDFLAYARQASCECQQPVIW